MTNELITGEVWGEDTETPRAFLLREAEKPLADLRPAVDAARQSLTAELQGISEAQSQFKMPGGEGEDAWSIVENARHIVRIERWVTERFAATARGEQPGRFAGPNDDDKSLAQMIDAYAESGSNLTSITDSFEGSENTEVTANHRQFGDLPARAWFRLIGTHSDDHARQLRRIKAHPDYPKA